MATVEERAKVCAHDLRIELRQLERLAIKFPRDSDEQMAMYSIATCLLDCAGAIEALINSVEAIRTTK